MMNEQENVQIIQRHFEAFGKGNHSEALDIIADKVNWQSPATRSVQKEVPWGKPRDSRRRFLYSLKNSLIKFSQKDLRYSNLPLRMIG